jgi:hypothetical protein
MSSTTTGLLGLIMWLALGFAFTQATTFAVAAWLQKPSPYLSTVEAVALAPSR